jgi:hypothetical protein
MEVAPCTDNTTYPEITGGAAACSAATDNTPPVIGRISAKALSPTSVLISWDAASDPESGVRVYRLYRNGNFLVENNALAYTDNTAQEGTTYSYQVSAVNFWDMESARSAPANVTTPADNEPPKVTAVNGRGVPPNVYISFDEPVQNVDAETPDNYTIDQGVSVLSTQLNDTGRIATLGVSSLVEGHTYAITIRNIRDRAKAQNKMADVTLNFQYFRNTPGNLAPTVSAGSNQTIVLPKKAKLAGLISDDGLPNPPGELTIRWTKESGQGTVKFTDDKDPETEAEFSQADTYVLRLNADDGEASSFASVSLTVQAPGGVPSPTNSSPLVNRVLQPSDPKRREINIPNCSNADLFDQLGHKVMSFSGPDIKWNGRRPDGKNAASGIYHFNCQEGEDGNIVVAR